MGEHTKKGRWLDEGQPGAPGSLIHEAVRSAFEVAVEERFTAVPSDGASSQLTGAPLLTRPG